MSKSHKRSARSKSDADLSSSNVISWSKNATVKCKTIGDRAAAFVWLTNHTAEYYESIEFNLNILLIIVGYLLGVGGMPTLIANADASVIRIFNGIIQGLVVVLSTAKILIVAYGFNKKVSKHRWASSAFSSLFLDIQKTLGQPVDKRENFHSFYERIQEKEFSLKRKTPYIPPRIVKNYYNILGSHALDSAILFGDIQEIEVFIEEGKQFISSRPPTNEVITNLIKRSESIRHKAYTDDLARSRLNLNPTEPTLESVKVEDPESETSTEHDLSKAKKISETRRYELERYFINDE